MINDLPHGRIEIVQNVTGGDTQHGDPAIRKKLVATIVGLWPIAEIMRRSVDLDRKLRRVTVEIGDKSPERMLPPKFETARSLFKFAPKQCFRQASLFSQLACAITRRWQMRPHLNPLPLGQVANQIPLPPGEENREAVERARK